MSKINAMRFINLNYNNNALKISDETLDLKGESTLLSLQNGGGKSVLVQMLMSLYVHPRYRNTKDRPFASYFTTNKPTFILVEWVLDHGAGYVLTGMMVRKNQDMSQDNGPELEMVNIIAEYKQRCPLDIYHIPVVEKTRNEKTLKNFGACRQLFEAWKKEREIPFFYYDMNQSAQAKQYFNKLAEYQIHYKEWETIIRKVNLKESGLSDLFADCRDERGLVDKWFLEAVENKLNKEKNRMQEFQGILEKYTISYKDNQSKIKRRDTIRLFVQESESIKEKIDIYQQTTERKQGQEARIADFIGKLKQFEEEEREKLTESSKRFEEYEKRLSRLVYEQLSSEIYKLEKEERLHSSNREMIQMEQEDLERSRDELSRRLHLLLCAKQQEEVDEAHGDLSAANQRLSLFREKMADLEPERRQLGRKLRLFYENALGRTRAEIEDCKERQQELFAGLEKEKKKQEDCRQHEKELMEKSGILSERIRQYDEKEQRFNQDYKQSWSRNILGEYEPGFITVQEELFSQQLEESRRRGRNQKKQQELFKEQERGMQRALEDKRQEKSELCSAIRENDRLCMEYEAELEERKGILPYFDMEASDLFETEKLLAAAERKLRESEVIRRGFEKEADLLEQEYKKLAQGQVLELSEEFQGLLEEAGITYTYGMEWLKKNKRLPKENQEITRRLPFLPYALIVTEKELGRLANLERQVYTSFPVPIMLRSELEKGEGRGSGVLQEFSGLSFYVWFNNNLLDEEKLGKLLKEKEHELQKIQKNIELKKQEFQGYFEKKQKIRNQRVTRQAYEEGLAKKEQLKKQLAELEEEMLRKREEKEKLLKQMQTLEKEIELQREEIGVFQRRMADFARMKEAYASYMENREQQARMEEEQERLKNQMGLIAQRQEKMEEEAASCQNQLNSLQMRQSGQEEKSLKFIAYAMEQGEAGAVSDGLAKGQDEAAPIIDELAEGQVSEAESRYDIITNGIAGEQKELEEQAAKSGKRWNKAKDELEHLRLKYNLERDSWKDVGYNRQEENHLEGMMEEKERKIEQKKGLVSEENIKLALLAREKKEKFQEMEKRCQMNKPLEKQEIQTIDYAQAIGELEHKKKQEEKARESIAQKMHIYEENLTALAEYEHFECNEPITWEKDLSALQGKEWREQKGILIRDYNELLRRMDENCSELNQVLNRMIRKEEFQDDFYQKSLEAMLNLSRNAAMVRKQLETALASYQNLMEKLLVDISFVEKEKEKIVELLGDYLKEVHINLGKIDQNSTITIREKPVKMLKIDLPDWEENDALYQLRLQDYVDDVTQKGIALLEENQNAMEFIGTKVTTKQLYDVVVGISNVQIRLYKIEAQREYAITWADVAKNSGGEGFLSAFVILSSLLYYMRKDDTDLFADRNEGKVLLMDNPFAQTNASHLLKPLMDMAKKTNTQLICLSGLGGESIYNRFDNIYVLNLIASNLRRDMQYLKADHVKGSDVQTMIAAQIEVMEQQELVF